VEGQLCILFRRSRKPGFPVEGQHSLYILDVRIKTGFSGGGTAQLIYIERSNKPGFPVEGQHSLYIVPTMLKCALGCSDFDFFSHFEV
jgi:hypothetical protein